MTKICFLGGSSPFTAAFFEALASSCIPFDLGQMRAEILLVGRNRATLDGVVTYGRTRLKASAVIIDGTTDLAGALEGSDIVIVQIRFGGLEARFEDELLAAELGCPADETLGPCGLRSAFRQAACIEELSEEISAHCPDALVINLINPLSLSTSIMLRHDLDAVGICELPNATLRQFAGTLRLAPDSVSWSYAGLNHRGFLFSLKEEDTDLIDAFAASNVGALDGIDRTDIIALHAVPLKYFQKFKMKGRSGIGRANELMALRKELAQDLSRNPSVPPRRLHNREMPWYAEALVPVLAARLSLQRIDTTLNMASTDGIVRERRVQFNGGHARVLKEDAPDGPAGEWVARFEHHERLSLTALADPHTDTIETALHADMITPRDKIRLAGQRILETHREQRLHL